MSAADSVSIIIPCHDAADFIGEAVASALAQDHPGLQVIVVDDASTDGSWEVIRSFGSRVVAERLTTNLGPGAARNRGASLATGDWLLFLDGDDTLSPDAVSSMVKAGREAPHRLVRCGWRLMELQDGRWTFRRRELRRRTGSADPLVAWLEGDWAPPGALLWPRETYERVAPWSTALRRNADGDIALRAFARGVQVTMAAGGEAFYRVHPAQRSRRAENLHEESLESVVAVLDAVVAILAERNRLDGYLDVLARAYAEQARYAFERGMSGLGYACLQKGGPRARAYLSPRSVPGRIGAMLLPLDRRIRVASTLRRLIAGGVRDGSR